MRILRLALVAGLIGGGLAMAPANAATLCSVTVPAVTLGVTLDTVDCSGMVAIQGATVCEVATLVAATLSVTLDTVPC